MADEKISLLVGAEKKLKDLVREAELMPLLKAAVNAGACKAALTDENGRCLCEHKGFAVPDPESSSQPLFLEGEPVGHVVVMGRKEDRARVRGISCLLRETLTAVINANLKRMLATEIHTNVVSLSHDELVETNARLRASEARYRELAKNLDKKVHERTEELKKALAGLLQREKMASIGRLAAGMAHELNNPLGFISSNLRTMDKYLVRLKEMIFFYQTCLGRTGVPVKIQMESRDKLSALRIDFILLDAKELIAQSLSGADRVNKIVSELKGFSHIDDTEETPMDLNTEIDKTLNVLAHETPPSAKIIRDYHPLPLFIGNPALICQVFLNIILNALQARQKGLELTISTLHAGGNISIRITDNGPGIPEELRDRIFDPFFTTKDVGSGTGMGLTVAYDIITACHGTIKLEDTLPGKGASFHITLPIEGGQNGNIR